MDFALSAESTSPKGDPRTSWSNEEPVADRSWRPPVVPANAPKARFALVQKRCFELLDHDREIVEAAVAGLSVLEHLPAAVEYDPRA